MILVTPTAINGCRGVGAEEEEEEKEEEEEQILKSELRSGFV